MIISLKSNKTRQFVANHLTNRDILKLIGLKPVKVTFTEQSKTYRIVDHPKHRLTEAEVKRYFHVIQEDSVEPVADEKPEIYQFPMSVLKQVTVKVHECTVNSDNLEEFIKQLRSKFE